MKIAVALSCLGLGLPSLPVDLAHAEGPRGKTTLVVHLDGLVAFKTEKSGPTWALFPRADGQSQRTFQTANDLASGEFFPKDALMPSHHVVVRIPLKHFAETPPRDDAYVLLPPDTFLGPRREDARQPVEIRFGESEEKGSAKFEGLEPLPVAHVGEGGRTRADAILDETFIGKLEDCKGCQDKLAARLRFGEDWTLTACTEGAPEVPQANGCSTKAQGGRPSPEVALAYRGKDCQPPCKQDECKGICLEDGMPPIRQLGPFEVAAVRVFDAQEAPTLVFQAAGRKLASLALHAVDGRIDVFIGSWTPEESLGGKGDDNYGQPADFEHGKLFQILAKGTVSRPYYFWHAGPGHVGGRFCTGPIRFKN